MATDYRYDQFNDVLETVERTELHVVPSVSPFVIHLDEVPLKGDPSTMIVREVTGTADGVRQYGRTFTEVAETPAQDTFRPDYNTGADGDANWSTGAMLFNAADASVMVEVTYQATGTLASLKTNHYPSWWTDRGDGSDGDFCPTAATTISGVKNYASVLIPKGVTVTVSPAALIKCQGAFVNNGTVTANGKGGAGGASVKGSMDNDGNTHGKIGNSGTDGFVSSGGAGGSPSSYTGGSGGGAVPYFNVFTPTTTMYRLRLKEDGNYLKAVGAGGGSGGTSATASSGAGGAGGGGILIAAGELYNTGTITANGTAGGSADTNRGSGGGGGGGAVVIIARRITNTGTITANGGAAGTGGSVGAAGEDGLVFMKEVDAL